MDWLGCILGAVWFVAAFAMCVEAAEPKAAHVMLAIAVACVFGAWVTG